MAEDWENNGVALLTKTLSAPPLEINELDWKISVSDNNDKLSKHLSAFANSANGGYLVFGIHDDGTISNIQREEADGIINKLGSIARNTLEPPIDVCHSIINFKGHQLLLVHIKESGKKPVFITAKGIFATYKRSAAQSVLATKAEVRNMIILSDGESFEDGIALKGVTGDIVISCIDYVKYFELHNFPLKLNTSVLEGLRKCNVIKKGEKPGLWDITNMGAILYASNINAFKTLDRKTLRFIIYDGKNKITAKLEQVGGFGYAVGFNGLINFIESHLPQNEVIEKALRDKVKMYPTVALREFIANALIHQDFYITGSGVMIELFDDRLEITNPGTPIVEINRFIDTARSRNEALAYELRQIKICEERGSGIDRALKAIEDYQLPAPKFITSDSYTKVILFAHKDFKDMDKDDRIRACFQHCALMYIEHKAINNQNIRGRFGLSEKQISVASKIITDTMDAGLIKYEDENEKSKRYAKYIPYWA